MKIHSRRIPVAVLGAVGLGLVPGLLAASGVVQLDEGRTLRGGIRAEMGAGLIVEPTGAAPVRVGFEELRLLKFDATTPTPDKPPKVRSESQSNLWKSANVGNLRLPGETVFQGDSMVVRASGTNVWTGGSDQCRFVFQKLKGNGSIVARIDQTEARWAGLMIRMDTRAESQFVMAALNGRDGNLIYCARRSPEYREKFKTEGDHHQRDGLRPPLWIRLDRVGKRFTAYISRDNRAQWEQVASSRGRHATEDCYGVFVSGGALDECRQATFSQVTATAASEGRAGASGKDNDRTNQSAPESGFEPYVLLRNGSVLKGTILELDPSGVRVKFLDEERFLSSVQVARAVWRPPPLGTGFLSPGRNGVLLTSGDFLEGELVSVKRNVLTINSVLLGQRKVDLRGKVVALVWNDLAPEPVQFVVHLRDGSVLRASRLGVEENAILAYGGTASPFRLPLAVLAEIRRE